MAGAFEVGVGACLCAGDPAAAAVGERDAAVERGSELQGDEWSARPTAGEEAGHAARGFGREDDEIARFRQHNDSVRDQQRDIFWRVATFSPMAQQLTQINLIVLLLKSL